MADIELTLSGDSSGAQAALGGAGDATRSLGEEAGKATVKWQMMADVATKAASAYVKWGVDAVKMFAEAQRAQVQLNRAAGEYGEILGEQAEAMSRLYAVDDDLIKQSYTLLAQWGGAGAATEEATKAVLNYAAATGTDAVSATQALIRNVESGGTGMAKMGIHFEATGKRGNDLAAAVGAINSKLGGAAESDAHSLVGSARAAHLAFEDLQKSIGGMLGTALDKSGALDVITQKLREVTLGGEVLFAVLQKLPGFLGGVVRGNIDAGTAIDELKNTAMSAYMGGGKKSAGALPGVANVATNKERKSGGQKAEVQAHEDVASAHDAIYRHEEESAAHTFNKIEKLRFDLASSSEDTAQAEAKRALEQAERLARDEAKIEERAMKDSMDRTAKEAQKAQQAGDAIGASFVNALSDQLSKLAAGEEFDVAIFVGDILASVIAMAGTVIGTAYGQPALGAAVGNLAAMGVRAGAGAISADRKKAKKHHSGGWVGDEGMGHDERPLIGQTGEHFASRAQVAKAGGRGAVDNFFGGGGGGKGLNVTVVAMDAKNAAEGFMGEIGRGLKDALRTGHGDLPSILGAHPR